MFKVNNLSWSLLVLPFLQDVPSTNNMCPILTDKIVMDSHRQGMLKKYYKHIFIRVQDTAWEPGRSEGVPSNDK